MRRVLSFVVVLTVWGLLGGITHAMAQTCPCSIWPATAVPAQIDSGDPTPGEYGMRFQTSVDGYIQGIRFYKASTNLGTHVGNLWSSSGALLASVIFTSETDSGWQQATFASPVAVTAGTTYIASYYAPNGHYSNSSAYFTTSVINSPLEALADGADGANGLYTYSGSSIFPTSTWNSGNYWVDVVYNQTDTPQISAFTPQSGTNDVSISPVITATFSEAMNPTSIGASSIQLLDQSNNSIAASVGYNATTFTATLQPSSPLSYSTVYTVIVRGGTSGPVATNLTGNALPSNFTWSFTTAASLSMNQCPCSIWLSSTIPSMPDGGDGSAGEYGVRFQASQSGYISGVRFYKSQSNTGAHVGNLWSNTGTLLASATFINETSSGWQQVNFSSPVKITAGVTYVASYFAPTGHYAYTKGGLITSVDNQPLTALADGTDGANAVYSYSSVSIFPTSTWSSSNYWVDVVFNTVDVPSVTGYSPLNGATAVPQGTSVSATFNEPLDPLSVDGNSIQLLDASNTPVSSSVSYNTTTMTAVLLPNAPLASGATYTAIVRGGLSGSVVRNLQGSSLPASFSWSFTTGSSSSTGACPCSIWNATSTPVLADSGEAASLELGVKFRADSSGYITGIRFFKSANNTGSHVGSLWSSSGTQLASAVFPAETAAGWQQVSFSTPVAISAGVSYVASYHTTAGHYAFDQGAFTSTGVDNAPLHALANGVDGPDGVFAYAATSTFPSSSFNASNYWVDVVYLSSTPTAPPTVIATSPANAAVNVDPASTIAASFSEAMDGTTINSAAFQLTDASGNVVPGAVTYSSASAALTFQPSFGLQPSMLYTATVMGTVKDFFGNLMAANFSWSFTTAGAPSDIGPGGPILVISSSTNPFSRYYGEILLAEGLNLYSVKDISTVTAGTLSSYDVAILGDMQLTSAQAILISNWVNAGGNLIAMHPDVQLASLLGLTSTSQTLSNAYLLMNTSTMPGAGLVNQTIQFHGSADLYLLNGATSIANLYSNAATATTYPAVAWRKVGTGTATVFTYDLARSIVYTRQGNPLWSGEQRDVYVDPTSGLTLTQIRSDDLFFGNAPFDPQPDWVDLTKVTIPQADEQQRLLANIIMFMQMQKKPLPRFWYLPSGFKAAVIMTGDDHNQGGTVGRFQNYIAASTPNCSVADWKCIRATSYMWSGTPITEAQATSFVSQGFELSFHPDSSPTCSNWTPSELADMYISGLQSFASSWPGLPAPVTVRTHCITWSDYDSQPQVELSKGIRLDTNYYYWPDPWVQDRPGFFTGSGMPMRFTDRSGNTIDVYQATTQFPDETTWTWPDDINTVLDNATGTPGYYGVFTTNFHTDYVTSAGSDAVVASAQAHGIPMVSAAQMLTWLDGRNGSSFGSLAWDGRSLSFTISQGAGARNLQAMLSALSSTGPLGTILFNGTPVTQTIQTIKGISYSFFSAAAGSYQAFYGNSISGTVTGAGTGVTLTLSGTSNISTSTDVSGNYSFGGLVDGNYTITPSKPGFVFTPQTVNYSGTPITGVNFVGAAVALQSIALSPTAVTGGNNATGTVTLNGPAPTGGAPVHLSSSNTAVATTAASVTVAAGASTATFTVTSSAVAVSSTATITATYGTTVSAPLTVSPPQVSSLTLNPASITGGKTSTGTITLTGRAPSGGVAVTLGDSSPSVSTPVSVTVAAGLSSATFTVSSTTVSTTTTASVTATFGTSSASATLTLNPAQVQSVTLSPPSITGGSANATATVTLTGAAPSTGAIVTLSSSNTAAATVPASVTVAANATAASFTVTSKSVSATATAAISATYNATASATLTVNPLRLSTITLNPASVVGGTSSTGTATLNGVAPSTGAVVTLTDNSSASSLPSTVTIASGKSSANFTVSTSPVSVQTVSTITGTFGNSASSNLTITAPQAQSLSLFPSTLIGGLSSLATVTLNGNTPTGGMVVTLSSSNTRVATVPTSVTVPPGARTAQFTVRTFGVSSTTRVTVSAARGTIATATLTITL